MGLWAYDEVHTYVTSGAARFGDMKSPRSLGHRAPLHGLGAHIQAAVHRAGRVPPVSVGSRPDRNPGYPGDCRVDDGANPTWSRDACEQHNASWLTQAECRGVTPGTQMTYHRRGRDARGVIASPGQLSAASGPDGDSSCCNGKTAADCHRTVSTSLAVAGLLDHAEIDVDATGESSCEGHHRATMTSAISHVKRLAPECPLARNAGSG